MRPTAVILLAAALVAAPLTAPLAAQRPALAIGPYAQPDGAISVFPDGSYVEPYFAMRALTTAADLGMDTDALSRAYVGWQLGRLAVDGTFKRSCKVAGGGWKSCASADADDAALGLWIELLYRTAGRSALPREWARSAVWASRMLDSLRDPATGVHRISRTLDAALFMDNIEIAASLAAAASTPSAIADGTAPQFRRRSRSLRAAVDGVFWDPGARRYRASTQAGATSGTAFYPDMVAQVYPAIFGFPSPVATPKSIAVNWLRDHGHDWVTQSEREYPWGLVAVAASRTGQRDAVVCWLGRAMSLRHGVRWNVLEETMFQALGQDFLLGGAPPPCRL